MEYSLLNSVLFFGGGEGECGIVYNSPTSFDKTITVAEVHSYRNMMLFLLG